jgi:hypothetical protein
MLVTDLSKDDTYIDLWYEYQSEMMESDDPLIENYLYLNPKLFACFSTVIEENRIVCFSALQINKWGDKLARCSTRMWIHPDHRLPGMSKFSGGDRFLNTTYCLPLQIAEAKKLGIECLFISRENNRVGFQEYINLIKINCGYDFFLEEQQYNVCGSEDPIPDSCKQFVAVCPLTKNGYNAWKENMDKFKL